MHIQTLTRTLRASLIPLFFLPTTLILSGCGDGGAAPPGKPGAAPETPSKPGSNYMQDMEKASTGQAKSTAK
jgi:hypothetical protein